MCKDGILKVDVSQATKHTVIQKIADALKNQVKQKLVPQQEQIIADLKEFKRLILFTGVYTLDKRTQSQVLRLLLDICHRIKSKFIVEIREPISDDLIASWSTIVRIEPSDRNVSLNLFKRQMKLEGKTQVTSQLKELDSHWLFDQIDRRSIQILVERINQPEDFDQLVNQLKLARRLTTGSDQPELSKTYNSSSHFEIRGILGTQQLKTLEPENYGMLNFLLLLCKTPKGLCKSDIDMMSQLTFAVKATFGQGGTDFELRFRRFIDTLTQSDSAFHKTVEVRKFLLTDENYYKIHKNQIDLLDDTIKNASFPSMVTETRLYKNLIEMCQQQARTILSAVSVERRHGPHEIEPELVTAHLQVGMWSCPNSTISMSHPAERFTEYILGNITQILNSDWLVNKICEIFNDEDKLVRVREQLVDLFVCVPSILIELRRAEEAQEIIATIKQLLAKTQKALSVAGALDLILASLAIHNQERVDLVAAEQILSSAFAIYRKKPDNHHEGLAEAFFLKGLIRSKQIEAQITLAEKCEAGSPEAKVAAGSLARLHQEFAAALKSARNNFS